MKKINFAIVGCGRICDLHAKGYLTNPNAIIYAICDIDEERSMLKANEWGVSAEKVYSDYSKMLKDDNIDVVELLIPHHLHASYTIEAAEAGKHVSVQKPMANTIRECDEMITTAEKNGVKLRVFENFRFYPPYMFAKEFVDSGKLGRPSAIHIKLGVSPTGGWEVPIETWAWRLDKDQCGGGPICWDDGYHKWSIARWFLGDIDFVFGCIDHTGVLEDDLEPLTDAPAEFIWKYKTPRTYGSMQVTYSKEGNFPSKYYSADERVEITGDKGYIWINQCTANTLRKEAPVITFVEGKITEYWDIETDWQASFTNGVNNLVQALINDTQPELTPKEGKKIMQFAIAAHRSAQTEKKESPEEIVD
ncbi:MAG: Gfo/Idh/MocA family protein [Promethearchaeota archaeon]